MSVTSKSILSKFPWYRDLPEPSESSPVSVSSATEDDQILDFIYAPDPVTGVPRSDLALMLSKDSSPEVAAYIRETLMSPVSSAPGLHDDPDGALLMVKSRTESVQDYANRLRELCSPSVPE